MQAIHSTWSKPRIDGCSCFLIEDFDILTTVLSALKWREKNGRISMITDSTGFEFYKSRNLLGLWDNVSREFDDIPDYVDPKKFWASGKLFALKNQDVPVAVIDTDFIVWDMLAFDKLKDITVIHREELYSDIYPEPSYFNMRRGYVFNPNFNWCINPVNTAFYVIKNQALKDLYLNEAMEFIKNSADGDNLTYMVFAEQRLLPMCAEILGIKIDEFSDLERLFSDGDRYFTHTWGMKQQMRDNPKLRRDFCLRCARRIKSDFPEFIPILSEVSEIKDYFA